MVQPVSLSPLVYQLTGFGQVYALWILRHLFISYGSIDEIDLKENAVKIMGPYDPTEPLARLIKKLEKGREFSCVGGQMIDNSVMVSTVITNLSQTATFNKYIQEWRRKTTNLNTWAGFKTFSTNTIVNKG